MSETSARPADLPHVAIGGRMQVGKTTCANHLVSRYGYARYALAEPIKELAQREFGWDGRKDDRGRRLLQEIGSAARAYDHGIWLRRFEEWFSARGATPVVIDDVRLPSEADFFREKGFLTILVLRPGFSLPLADPALREHETERELEPSQLDLVITNAGTIADLHRAVDEALAGWISASR
jgi:hypothetical protein